MKQCFICNKSNFQQHYNVDHHKYMQCSNCKLIFVDVIENWDVLQHSYDGGLLKSLRRKLMLPFKQFKNHKNFSTLTHRADSIIKFIEDNNSNSTKINFLDIGCNKGFLLASAIKKSWNVYGIEVVGELLGAFRKHYKDFSDQTIVGKINDFHLKFNNTFFDIITAIDVIEHLEDPVKEMQAIYEMLSPNGIFVIQTPDTSCQQAVDEKEKWGALKPLEHLHLFSPNNLETFAKKIGYKDIAFFPCFEEADGNFVAILKK